MVIKYLSKLPKASLLNGVLTCLRALRALRAWHAHEPGVLVYFTCSRACRARVLYELGVFTCLASSIKWRA